jgi:uncharacterized protein YdeI (YjbR/CyaY-like superfamily)
MREKEIVDVKSIEAWRKWLEKHHLKKDAVRLVFYTKASGKVNFTWAEAVSVALCYGWIDSKKIKIDDHTSHQHFSKRKAKSTWSKINKDKVEQLIAAGHMSEAGLKSIEIAKQNGSWNSLDAVEELIIPKDLELAFRKNKKAKDYFLNLSKSKRKLMLYWLMSAKREETRAKRLGEIIASAGEGRMPGALGG